jgi:hypothetical protein
MSSRAMLARLRKLREQLPDLPGPECESHARFCPLGSLTGQWWGLGDVAVAYEARHGIAFTGLPCTPGDPAGARCRLAQAGVLEAVGPHERVVYIILGVDLDAAFR